MENNDQVAAEPESKPPTRRTARLPIVCGAIVLAVLAVFVAWSVLHNHASVPPPLKAVDVRTSNYLARIETHTTISPSGFLRALRTDGKSFGPNDVDPKGERTETRERQLTPQEVVRVAAVFADWNSLSKSDYGHVADGLDWKLGYGAKSVSGAAETPPQVAEALKLIGMLERQTPVGTK